MKKINTSAISGMQELLPRDQATFDKIKSLIVNVYHSHGFQHIETPIIDRTEILLAKAGGDTEKQIYKVVKTAETADDADQALRFDHTVPLARYVVEHENELAFPFRVTQIDRNFRGERAQKGRFREFYQLDVDVIGRENLAISYDAEVVATAVDALKTFIDEEFIVQISNRKLLSGLLNELNLSSNFDEIAGVIDHIEKVPLEVTMKNLEDAVSSSEKAEIIKEFLFIDGESSDYQETIQKLRNFNEKNGSNEIFAEGINELETISNLLSVQGINNFTLNPRIIRGLDYYTGTVFETFMTNYRKIGSICSGGRYENLAENYTDQKFPGVGISIGLSRLFFILNEYDLIKKDDIKNPTDIAIVPISENEFDFCLKLAAELRSKDFSADVILTNKKLGDKMSHAAKVANFGVVIGEDEKNGAEIEIKNFATGEKSKLNDFQRL